jgi:hypothetical protein
MNLYLITRGDDNESTYDANTAHVVAAGSPEQARIVAYKVGTGDENRNVWFAPTTTVVQVGTALPGTESGIVLTDYRES